MRKLLVIVILAVAACTGTDPAEPGPSFVPADPAAVVDRWLQAVAGGDTTEIDLTVEPTGLAVLAGVENGLRSAELAALLESGFSPELATDYWTRFRRDFEAIRGASLGTLSVGEERPIAGNSDFVSVAVSSTDASGAVLLRRVDVEPGWRVDIVATAGIAFVGPLGEYLDSALGGDHAELIAGAYREGVLPGLEAAVAVDTDNANLAFETEYIRQLLERR